jgi:hypothetical protein
VGNDLWVYNIDNQKGKPANKRQCEVDTKKRDDEKKPTLLLIISGLKLLEEILRIAKQIKDFFE